MEIRDILLPYTKMAGMLAKTFGSSCEVVVHDLRQPEQSVVFVANGTVTGRQVGQSFDQLVKQVMLSDKLEEDYVANYYFVSSNGKRIRSSTQLIRNDKKELEGALCINVDMEPVYSQLACLEAMLPASFNVGNLKLQPEETLNVSDMVSDLIDNIVGDIHGEELSREERLHKIRFMQDKGIFLMKGSVDRVAQKMGINKVTVYSYLDEIKKNR